MSHAETLLIVFGSILSYLAMAGVSWVLFSRKTSWDKDEGCVVAAALWVIFLPIMLSVWVTEWLLRPKSTIPKAKVVP